MQFYDITKVFCKKMALRLSIIIDKDFPDAKRVLSTV